MIWRGCFASALVAGSLACQSLPGGGRAIAECPGEIASTAAIPGAFLLRQSWRITSDGETYPLEIAVQVDREALVIVGLHPLGGRLFAVRQQGEEIEVDAQPPPALEVPAENVLWDVHRMLALSLPPPPGEDGWAESIFGNARVAERWESGTLRERRVEMRGATINAAVLRFEGDPASDGGVVHLSNRACGYEAEIRTLSRRGLP